MGRKRLLAWIIDFLVTCFIQMILMMLFLILPLMHSEISNEYILIRQLMITYCSVLYLVVRDVLGKRSIGKKIFKLEIIDKKTGKEAVFGKRLLRNIPWLLGPVEIICFLITKERLGDKISGTGVVECI